MLRSNSKQSGESVQSVLKKINVKKLNSLNMVLEAKSHV